MNLFYLHEDLDKCAEYHVDKHVGKMQLETAQMMCTAHWVDHVLGYIPRALNSEELAELKEFMKTQRPLPQEERIYPYLAVHFNHPSTVWIRESYSNYEWAFCYAAALSSEQHYRTGGTHKAFEVIKGLPDPKNLKDIGPTPFKLAMTANMPEHLRDDSRPIWSYRNFYMLDKGTMATWKYREKPDWWSEELARYDSRVSLTKE